MLVNFISSYICSLQKRQKEFPTTTLLKFFFFFFKNKTFIYLVVLGLSSSMQLRDPGP